MAQKLIIDADPGIVDALAVLVAMADPSVDLLAVTATAGSVSGIQATRNLQYLVELVDPVRHPRVGQSDIKVAFGADSGSGVANQHAVNGALGLGDLEFQVPDLHNRRESAKVIVDIVREYPREVKILTLGPLNNLLMAYDLEPQLPELLAGVVAMGGCVTFGGDVTAAAEFNIWADPEAARSVFRLPLHRMLVPLDIRSPPVLTFEDVELLTEFINGTASGTAVASMLQFSVRSHHQHMGLEGIPLNSVAALAVAAKAERFTAEAALVDVETSGELTRGMTVFDRRRVALTQTNVDVVTSVDAPGIIDYFSRSIRRVTG
ncbi:MAG: nucleoside hydrolase [Planctomycetaceae bacterium]